MGEAGSLRRTIPIIRQGNGLARHKRAGFRGGAKGAVEVLAAKQAPGDDDEGGQGNAENHAENAPQGGPPEEDGNDHDDGMKTGLLAHDLGGQVVALDQLNNEEGNSAAQEDGPFPGLRNAPGLEVSDEHGRDDPHDGPEVGHDVEQAEEQAEGDPELQAADGEESDN